MIKTWRQFRAWYNDSGDLWVAGIGAVVVALVVNLFIPDANIPTRIVVSSYSMAGFWVLLGTLGLASMKITRR